MLNAAVLIIFPALMAYAAFSDMFTMTISNRVSLALVVAFAVLALLGGVPWEIIGWHFTCAAGVLAITFTLFACGWIGGGDAKLAAATALWLGWDHMVDYGSIASLLGGVLTLFFLHMRKWPLPDWLLARQWIARLYSNSSGVPYGIALAAAGLIVYPGTPVWQGALGQ